MLFFADSILAQKSVVQTIVLDAGHGGKDPGAPGTGRYTKTEKHIALDVTLKLGKYLKEAFPEMKIVYTRTKDTFPTLKDRTDIANNSNADLFISIHCDSFTKSSAKGSSSHVMGLRYTEANLRVAQKENSVIFLEDNYEENYDGFDPNSPESIIAFSLSQTTYLNQSILIAQKIQEQFRERVKRTDRGVKQTPLWVTRATNMPSVLVETGFLTNKREGAYLNSKKGQNEMSKAIAMAIVNYKNELEKGVANQELFDSNETANKKTKAITKKNNDIRFMVQLAASKTPIDPKPYNFKGLKNVVRDKEGTYYKYYFGNSNSYKQIQKEQRKVRKAGFKSAFIVSFRGNQKIRLSEALDALK